MKSLKSTFVIITAIFMASCTQKTQDKLKTDIDMNYYAGVNKVNFTSEGTQISGHLFLPGDLEEGEKLPVIVIVTPASGVKEQTAGIHAEKLAKNGFITLAFDHRTYGESEGEPRGMESVPMKVEDIKNAVSFVSSLDFVDKDRVGMLGICSGAGYATIATVFDRRIKALATVSGFYDFVDYGMSGGTQYSFDTTDAKEQFRIMVKQANDARQKYYETGEVEYTFNFGAPGTGPNRLWQEASEYYQNSDKGGVPTWSNKRAVMSLDTRYAQNASDVAHLLDPIPFLAVVGSEALSAPLSDMIAEKITGDKEVFRIDGATHIDMYYKDQYVKQTIKKLTSYYTSHLLNQ